MLVLGRLAEAAQSVSVGRLRPFFAAHGLQPGEFDVLATLRRAGSPHALSPTALYDATMVTSGAMTGRLDKLDAAGLIRREPDPGDRRGVLVVLTPKGFALINGMMGGHVANGGAALAGLTREEQEVLAELLGKVIAAPDPAASVQGRG